MLGGLMGLIFGIWNLEFGIWRIYNIYIYECIDIVNIVPLCDCLERILDVILMISNLLQMKKNDIQKNLCKMHDT